MIYPELISLVADLFEDFGLLFETIGSLSKIGRLPAKPSSSLFGVGAVPDMTTYVRTRSH